MTPKEKAKELLEKMNVIHYLKGNGLPVSMHKSQVKKCALIAVDEVLSIGIMTECNWQIEHLYSYWAEVKKEIEKL